jgi:hypothetical protein
VERGLGRLVVLALVRVSGRWKVVRGLWLQDGAPSGVREFALLGKSISDIIDYRFRVSSGPGWKFADVITYLQGLRSMGLPISLLYQWISVLRLTSNITHSSVITRSYVETLIRCSRTWT